MQTSQLKLFFCCLVILLISACTMIKHGDDPDYTKCKVLENKLTFPNNSTLFSTNPTSTYSEPTGDLVDEDRDLDQAAYDKLNCSRYHAFKLN